MPANEGKHVFGGKKKKSLYARSIIAHQIFYKTVGVHIGPGRKYRLPSVIREQYRRAQFLVYSCVYYSHRDYWTYRRGVHKFTDSRSRCLRVSVRAGGAGADLTPS